MGRHGASSPELIQAEPDLLELVQADPIARPTLNDGGYPISPDAFKENAAPKHPLSGGKTRSPGLSPLGRKRLARRTEMVQIEACSPPEVTKGRTPKRSLNFGGDCVETSPSLRSRKMEDQSLRKDSPVPARNTTAVSVDTAETGLTYTREAHVIMADLNIKEQPLSSPEPTPTGVHRNDDILNYEFSEDGEPVNPGYARIDPNVEKDTDMTQEGHRIVLGELEKMKFPSPPASQKISKSNRIGSTAIEESPSRKGSRAPRTLFTSQPTSPITSPIRI